MLLATCGAQAVTPQKYCIASPFQANGIVFKGLYLYGRLVLSRMQWLAKLVLNIVLKKVVSANHASEQVLSCRHWLYQAGPLDL